MLKHLRFAVGIATFLFLAQVAHAEAPLARFQVPGYYRVNLGAFEVTALYDGAIELDTKLLKDTESVDLGRLLSRMFVGNPKMQTAVNAYLINTGSHLVLVDTGAAKLFGPSLGFVLENMRAAGYEPGQVDTVIVTHLHGDHMGGLKDAGGQPVFANAKVFVSKEDNDFWLSQKVADGAPAALQPYFKMARDVAAPYLATSRWATFAEGSELVPGVKAVRAFGHTPGHTAYAIESEGQKLLIWGDVVHAHAVQFAKPGVSIEFDTDRKQAVATRRQLMKSLASSKSLVAGMHLPFPGIGHVRAEGHGSYSWVPIEIQPRAAATKQ